MDESLRKEIWRAQKSEITEHAIYSRLAAVERDAGNRRVLDSIAADELRHHAFFGSLTGRDAEPDRLKVFLFVLCARVLGLSFTLRLLEKGEVLAQDAYESLAREVPEAEAVSRDEHVHEMELLSMINEERLAYTGSVVLGLNDALVELTGALAGFTLALQQPRLIAAVGVITGLAAAMSMGAAEYLSTKEEGQRSPLKASLYTGIAYLLTVSLLVSPFLVLPNPLVSLAVAMCLAVLVIFVFNFYIAVARGLGFRRRFLEMAGISLGVALVNFFIGLAVKRVFNVSE